MSAREVKFWRYSLPSIQGEGWAEIVLTSTGMFAAVSDWGNYAYAWRCTAVPDFRRFIAQSDRDPEYILRKLAPEKEWDGDATRLATKRRIIALRRLGHFDAEQARAEWERATDFESEVGFTFFVCDTEIPDVHDLPRYRLNRQAEMFCKHVLPRLAEAIRTELAAEAASVRPENDLPVRAAQEGSVSS